MLDTATLAQIIDVQGIEAAEPHISHIVTKARGRNVNPVVVDVLADTSAPEVARLRALARVQRYLSEPAAVRRAAA